MSEERQEIILSTPRTLRDLYPEAGWESTNGSLHEAMPQYPEVTLPAEISSIVREIITKVEAAIRNRTIRIGQHQTIQNLRSMSFHIPVEIPIDHLWGSRGKMQKPSRKEIIEMYKRAGWHSVDIANPTWIRGEIRKLTIRLTYWQALPPKEGGGVAAAAA